MEKRADNTFVGGLNTDRHPLASSKEELIEAFNIDLGAVGEGYQLILQKREGNSELLIYNPNTQLFESAGLPEGFIPLAVKEFNNIAYIISVNPDTGEGELGTFPSPDYAQFVYVEGADPIPTTITVGAGIYDPSAVPPPYGYTYVYAGPMPQIDWELWIQNSPDNPTIDTSISVITHIGYMPDSYDLALSTPANYKLYYSVNYNPIYTEYTGSPVTLNLGDTMSLAVSVVDPWLYDANDTQTQTITVTPAVDTTIRTHTFQYHTMPAASIRNASGPGDWGYSESLFYTDGNAHTNNYNLRTNDPDPGTFWEIGTTPIIPVGDPGNWVQLSADPNVDPFQIITNSVPSFTEWNDTDAYNLPAPGDPALYVRYTGSANGYLYLLLNSVPAGPGNPPPDSSGDWKRIPFLAYTWDNTTPWTKGITVSYLLEYYTALETNTNVIPDSDPAIWEALNSASPTFVARTEYITIYLKNGLDVLATLPIWIIHTYAP